MRKRKTKGGYTWIVDYYHKGRRHRKSTGTSNRKQAELILKDIEVRIAKGNFGFNDHKKVNLSEFKAEYLEYSKSRKADNSYRADKYSLNLFFDYLKDIYLHRITVADIENFITKRLQTVKESTVNVNLRHLKSAFEKAVASEHIPENPFKKVKLLKVKNSNIPKFFTKDQIKELLNIIPEGAFKNLIYFYLYTGCRRNEALNITWDEINLNSGKVTFKETKSGNDRKVPFNGYLTKMLNAMDKQEDRPFPFRGDYVTHKFKKYLRKTEIKNKEDLNVHSLRHTFASHLVMAGVNLLTVSKLLGHSSVKVTEVYAHLIPDHLKTAVEHIKF
ncbi:MAG: tyrosine-type recombinase/integrase [bacterium]